MPRRKTPLFLRALIVLLVLVVAGYGGALVWLKAHQREFIYFPGKAHVPPSRVNLDEFQAVEIRTPDGERLVGWWKPPPRPGEGVVLYLHGNGSDLTDRAPRFRDLGVAGFGVLGIDWRGYGGSTGKPSETGLNTDALAAYDWIRAQRPDAKIAVFGESLGTGPSMYLATRRPVAGVLIDSGYASILRLASRQMPLVPVSWLLTDTYKAEDRVAHINAPLLMAHCDADDVIPITEGRRLFAAAREPKQMLVLHGCGHVETWREPQQSYMISRLHTWLDPQAGGAIAPKKE
jgi:hypothetical protein